MDDDRNKKKIIKSKETASYLMQKLNEQKHLRLGVAPNSTKDEYREEIDASRVGTDDEM